MNGELEREVWGRVREGRHVAVIGPQSQVRLKAPADFQVVHVTCDGPWTTWGPLEDARARVEGHLNGESFLSQARERVMTGLRRRLLGDVGGATLDAALVEACNALFTQTEGRAVLVLDQLQAADTATLEALRSLVRRTGWLRMPLVLLFREPPTGLAQEVLALFRETYGEDAVLNAAVVSEEVESPPEASATSAAGAPPRFGLDPDVLRVMRAASILGEVFEVALLSRLLREEPSTVLYALQRAWDGGLPIEDRGEGRFAMPLALCESLASSVLPSLRTFWHEQLATLLSPVPAADSGSARSRRLDAQVGELLAETEAPSSSPPVAEIAGFASLFAAEGERVEASEVAAVEPAPDEAFAAQDDDDTALVEPVAPESTAFVSAPDETVSDAAPAEMGVEGISLPGMEEREAASAASPEAAADEDGLPDPFEVLRGLEAEEPGGETVGPPPAGPRRGRESRPLAWRSASHPSLTDPGRRMDSHPEDTARAAVHLEAAGQREAAIERYIDAARQVAVGGDARRAYLLVRQALGLLEQSPTSPALRRLRGRALMEQGRLLWRGSVLGPPFTLANALASLDEAKRLLAESLTPELMGELSKLIAGVCFDIGDDASLKRALEELTVASRSLLEQSQPTAAARLLNDQAAVWIRLGDPVRAVHLLNQSRGLFAELLRNNPDEPIAMVELAETEHLLARLPMHAPARAGRQDDAWGMGLEYAHAAAQRYERLGLRLELGRVWETIGCLELRRGRFNEAAEYLNRALQMQQALGDVTGLARSAATMSELLLADGQVERAFALLADSVALNFEKGSASGLIFNRKALERLAQTVATRDGRVDPRLGAALGQLDAQIREGIEHGARALG